MHSAFGTSRGKPLQNQELPRRIECLERLDQDLMALSSQDLAAIPGIGKSILEAIQSLKETGSFLALDALLEQTPTGVLEILQVKGLGPKKFRCCGRILGLPPRTN